MKKYMEYIMFLIPPLCYVAGAVLYREIWLIIAFTTVFLIHLALVISYYHKNTVRIHGIDIPVEQWWLLVKIIESLDTKPETLWLIAKNVKITAVLQAIADIEDSRLDDGLKQYVEGELSKIKTRHHEFMDE